MIDTPLDQITYADIDRFVQEKWPEGKTVEYKRDLYGNRDEDKKELLKDVSSFANTQAGDILIGVDEDKGVPTGIPGVSVADVDKEKLRMEEIVRRGLDPRIEFDIHHVLTPTSTAVVVMRVKESLLFPHRVVYQGKFGEFWARSSAGKYSMDTDELRRAFTLSGADLRSDQGVSVETVWLRCSGGDARAAHAGWQTDFAPYPRLLVPLPASVQRGGNAAVANPVSPSRNNGVRFRLNLDGHVCFDGRQAERVSRSYTQFFRTGIVESVLSDLVLDDNNRGTLLLASYFERTLLQEFHRLLNGFKDIGIQPPIWGFLTITGVKGARIPTESYSGANIYTIDRDTLLLPEFVIDDLGTKVIDLLRPTFDLVWNSFGVCTLVQLRHEREMGRSLRRGLLSHRSQNG